MDQQAQMYSLVQEWKESGLSKGKFTSQKLVSYHRFNYWLKKYNKHHSAETDNAALTFFQQEIQKFLLIKRALQKRNFQKRFVLNCLVE